MNTRRLVWIFWGILAISALILLYFSLQSFREVSIIVEWSTASEMDTAGFNLYRSTSEDGPYERINPSLIPGSTDPQIGGDYEFVDEQVEPGVVYFYQLEEVETTGEVNQYDPIQIEAESGGRLELILALALVILVLLGLGLQLNNARKKGAGEGAISEAWDEP